MIRLLVPGDEAALEAFLVQHRESSMFLRSNVRAAGLTDRGSTREATYAAAFEGGAVVAVAGHCWNGMVIVQAPVRCAEVTEACIRIERPITGFMGPYEQAQQARAALDLAEAETTTDEREVLYRLKLSDMRLPPSIESGRWICRPSRREDLDLLVPWRIAYMQETLGMPDNEATRQQARREMERCADDRIGWVLVDEERVRAFSAFNAELPDVVQVGGVYAPPHDRRRGYGRGVVAGSLLSKRARGVEEAILFTQESNLAGQRAYQALGFVEIGTYGLVLLKK